jgi:hypothetical protein
MQLPRSCWLPTPPTALPVAPFGRCLNRAAGVRFACRRLRALDAELVLDDGVVPPCLEELPISLRELRLRQPWGTDFPLPAGQYLW